MKNFNLIDEKYIEDVHSKVSYYEHIKTKAKIVTLENNMDNLAFGIGFRTPPKDSSGVAHIIEHSVLGTSRKSVIGLTLDVDRDDRMAGTVATTVMGYERGCTIFRVHDVKENYQALMMAKAIKNVK